MRELSYINIFTNTYRHQIDLLVAIRIVSQKRQLQTFSYFDIIVFIALAICQKCE